MDIKMKKVILFDLYDTVFKRNGYSGRSIEIFEIEGCQQATAQLLL